MLADQSGIVFEYDGTWGSGVHAFSGGFGRVILSCATSTFCVAVGDGSTYAMYMGDGWQPQFTLDEKSRGGSISCPTDGFCMSVGSDNRYVTYTA
jgi:hypothetical protein